MKHTFQKLYNFEDFLFFFFIDTQLCVKLLTEAQIEQQINHEG